MNTTHKDCLLTKEKDIPTNSYPFTHACKEALNALYGMNGVNIHIRIRIVNVIFNEPATIVFWSDGSKTVVKAQNGEIFDPEKGLAMAILKRIRGNKGRYNNEFKKWLSNYHPKETGSGEK